MYNGLQLSVNRRFAQGLSFGMAYTLSRTNDAGSAQRDVVPNAYDTSNLWGPAGYDRRHVMVLNAIYELPIFKDRSKLSGKLFGGWTISAVSQMQTGTPISIGSGDDFAGVGTGSGAQFWRVNGDPVLDNSQKKFATLRSDPNFWFRAADANGNPLFTRPTNGTIVTDRVRGILYGPGFQNHNFGLFKEFTIKETHKVVFRLEAFNWPNHPNWGGPDTNPNNIVIGTDGKVDLTRSSFGKITGKGGDRQLQLSLRYQF